MTRNEMFGIALCVLLAANIISAVNYSSMKSIFFVTLVFSMLLIILLFCNPDGKRSKREVDALNAELKKLGFNQQVNQSPIKRLDFVAGDGEKDDFFVGVDNFLVVALRKSEMDSVEINKQMLYYNNQYCVVEDILYRQTPLRLFRK